MRVGDERRGSDASTYASSLKALRIPRKKIRCISTCSDLNYTDSGGGFFFHTRYFSILRQARDGISGQLSEKGRQGRGGAYTFRYSEASLSRAARTSLSSLSSAMVYCAAERVARRRSASGTSLGCALVSKHLTLYQSYN